MTDAGVDTGDAATVLQGGWRPVIGWACVFAFVYQAPAHQIANWVAAAWFGKVPTLEALDPSTMLFVVAILGALAGLRTAEKIKGVSAA